MPLALWALECQVFLQRTCLLLGGDTVAKTKSSKSGTQHKKIVPVKPYKKADGTKVSGHRRSTPN